MLNFIKCHGTGNDFVLVDEITNSYNFTEEDRKNFAITVCDRNSPIGADGVLFVLKSSTCHGKMRIFNSDGSEPEMCGNGLRCVGRYVMDLLNLSQVKIETMKAQYSVYSVEDIHPGVRTVKIEIDTVNFDVSSLPLNYPDKRLKFSTLEKLSKELKFTGISITNPHLVSIVDEISECTLVNVGLKANNTKDLLPNGTNVNLVKLLDSDSIYVRTFERGVGLTKSCGTGMTASCIAVSLQDSTIIGKELKVFNDGGMIKCIVHRLGEEDFKVDFIGNASYVYKGSLHLKTLLQKGDICLSSEFIESETDAYDRFLKYAHSQINR
jgi:diaminopimelate epimerase